MSTRNTIICYCPKCGAQFSALGAYSSTPREKFLRNASLSDLEALQYLLLKCPRCHEDLEVTFTVAAWLEPAGKEDQSPICIHSSGRISL